MMNYKCKSHRGRSPQNKTDALVIVECVGSIPRIHVEVIPNKCATTILPIIHDHVYEGSIIYTDEHKSYQRLNREGFFHSTVCHKYNFVDKKTGVHTQHVEALNGALKYEIKSRKGIKTNKRAAFLSEFVWKWNKKSNLLQSFLDLIKISR